jgi:2-oxoglutarate ferredoxin oxidoreductase subunit beta
MGSIITEAHNHKGTSFVEIYQNCNIFNDNAFESLTNRTTKLSTRVILENGKPMLFGEENNLGLKLEGSSFKVIEIGGKYSIDDVLVHNMNDKNLGILLSEMTYDEKLPVPFGVFYKEDKPTYENMMVEQIDNAIKSKGKPDLQSLIDGFETWEVK